MWPIYRPTDGTLVPSTHAEADCAYETLPFANNQVVQTRPATTGPGFWRDAPRFAGRHALGSVFDHAHRLTLPSGETVTTHKDYLRGLGNLQNRVANNPAPLCANLGALGAVETIASQAYKDGNFSWVDLQPKNGPRMRITHRIGRAGLGSPVLMASAAGVIGALASLVQNALADDWTHAAAFRANTSTIHNSMTQIQCLVGGASRESYGCTSPGESADGRAELDCLCPAGTAPLCPLPQGLLADWRTLRREWSAFYKEAGSEGTARFGGATEGEAQVAKGLAQRMLAFYEHLADNVCPSNVQGSLPDLGAGNAAAAQAPRTPPPGEDPTWLTAIKWTAGGVVAIGAIYAIKTTRDLFSK
jgi:hypothetical protein